MKFISWNVNGLRAALKKGFLDFMETAEADVLCLQETRAGPDQVKIDWPAHYCQYWNPAVKKGYSGTAIFSRIKPEKVSFGIGLEEDAEGRVITLQFKDFFLVNVYTPNARRDLSRLTLRHEFWDLAFLRYLKRLESDKPVIFCGDLNVAHEEIDLANPAANRRNAGFTDEERSGMSNYLAAGFIDSFREFERGGGHYTWWSYRNNARARNIGWRIDYFCLSQSLRGRLQNAFILPRVHGSDHCPVGIILK